MVDRGDDIRYRMPLALLRSFIDARIRFIKARKVVQDYLGTHRRAISEEGLREQGKKMREFYAGFENNLDKPSLDHEIYLAILDHELVKAWLDKYLTGDYPKAADRDRLRAELTVDTTGRVQSGDTHITVFRRLEELLGKAGQTLDAWRKPDGTPTEKYIAHQEQNALLEIDRVRHELWKILVQRRIELDRLHGSSTIGMYLPWLRNHLTVRDQAREQPNQNHSKTWEANYCSYSEL